MKRKGINLTLQQADEHQKKHGFPSVLNKCHNPGCPARTIPCPLKKSKQPNKTEAEFGRLLESQKQRGEILRYVYEGVTFRWLDMRYTPDWMVVYLHADNLFCGFKAIEVKGPHIFDRDIVRFKGARALWPEIAFEMWQKKNGQWARIH